MLIDTLTAENDTSLQ